MSTWRSPELEVIFGGPLNETNLSETRLGQIVQDGVTETEQLDFKETVYPATRGPRPAWTKEQEFAKDVAAFANHRGGVILFGIKEQDDVAIGLAAVTGVAFATEAQRLRQALVNYIAPMATIAVLEIPSTSGGWYMAVVVPPSERSPHAVLSESSDSKRPLRYPVRHGTGARWLTEHEVAERYRSRFRSDAEHRALVEGAVGQGCEAVGVGGGIWLYLAVVPEFPVIGKLNRASVEAVDKWLHHNLLNGPLGGYLRALGRGIPGPGKVSFTGSQRLGTDDETFPREGYVELHMNGAAFVATPLGGQGEGRSIGIDELRLVEDVILLSDLSLSWTARQAGAWGTAVVVAGVLDATGAPPPERFTPLMLMSSAGGIGRRIQGTRILTRAPRVTTAADLGAVGSVQERLAVAYNVAAAVLQWFGLAEPHLLRQNGSLTPRHDIIRHRQIEEWAFEKGVEIEP